MFRLNLRVLLRPAAAWKGLRPLVGGSWAKPAGLAIASMAAGLSEASLVSLIAQAALALSRGARGATFAMGPFVIVASVQALIGTAAALALARLILMGVVAWLPARISADVQYRLQVNLFHGYANADWPTQAADREGYLQELLTTYANRASGAVLAATTGLASLFSLLALVAAGFAISPTIALILAATALGLFTLLRPVARVARHFNQQVSRQVLDVAGAVSEMVRLAEETNVFGAAVAQERRFRSFAQGLREPVFRALVVNHFVSSAYQSVALLLLIGGLASITFVGAPRIAALGTVVLILVRSLAYGQQVQTAYTALNTELPFVDRLEEAIDRYRKLRAHSGDSRIETIESLSLEEVAFRYKDGHEVLHGVSVGIDVGQIVGIVGPSGSGKTTLAQILLRLRTPTSGDFIVNGTPSELVSREDWRRLVAYVPQDPKLFHGSIADNIRFFRDLDLEVVGRAARLAHIHEEICSYPGGYEAVIDQRGDTVSGGQRQRICLARALALKPKLLVLDEPTSSLDAHSESLILQTLHDLRGEMIVVIVAHRMSLMEVCDQVWQVSEGHLEPLHQESILSNEGLRSLAASKRRWT